MSIIFSRQCEYALQAVLFLAKKGEGSTTSIRELTETLHTPHFFMAKILQDLSHRGILVSQKGPAGGFALAKPAEEISLFEIVEAIDGNELLEDCVLGFPTCSPENPCAMHDQWLKAREGIHDMLTKKTIAQMSGAMRKPEYLSHTVK